MNVRRSVPLTLAGAGLLIATAGAVPALAASPSAAPTAKTCAADRLTYVQARVDAAVHKREATIDDLTKRLADRTHVTDAHRATLSATYTSDADGLRAVDAKVQADTTCMQAVADGHRVVTDYRVYLLLVPQTHLVTASDTGMYAADRLTAAEPKVQAAIDALTDPQKKATAQSQLDDLKAHADAATAAFAGVADGMLALNPADIPAKESVIDGYRAKVRAGHTDLAKALADAKSLRTLLGKV